MSLKLIFQWLQRRFSMNRKPVIVITPRTEKDIHQIPNNGGGTKLFDVNLAERRLFLSNCLKMACQELEPQFLKYPSFPEVIKITVRDDAIAKSHRPNDFLRCMKVLTYGLPTEIYVAVSSNDLNNAILDCQNRDTIRYNANISSIVSIQSVLPKDKKVIINNSSTHSIVLKMLDYRDEIKNKESDTLLNLVLEKYNTEQHIIKVGRKNSLRVIKKITNDGIKAIMDLPFVMSIRETVGLCGVENRSKAFDYFKPIRSYLSSDDIIAVVDSGISKEVIGEKNIYGKEEYVPVEYQDNSHGTFVASTILFGNEINNRPEINPTSFKLLDVVALPDSNKNVPMYEDEFCECLKDAVEKHHEHVKIWNLSLGFRDVLAKDEAISYVGSFCDDLQKEFNVQFIISTGNYDENPPRHWPVFLTSGRDRIISPGDSIMAITVGSLAEKDAAGSFSKKGAPSPFSRRGPGACSLFKPDLTDYGGNSYSDYSCEDIGVVGLNLDCKKQEEIGTSFSAPLVSYKFAKIYSLLQKKDLLLAKTLLIHDALRHSPNIINCEEEQRKYYGFGQPSNDCEYVLNCSANEITVVLECEITSGTMVDIKEFPFPEAMIDGEKCKGEIFATLVSEPFFDKEYGSEYSRIDFNLSIGTFSYREEDEGVDYFRQVEPLKPGKNKYKFESELVEEDLKWNPIKTYHRKFKDGTDLKDGWRISVQLHSRFQEAPRRHKCYVAITFIGEDDTVYDEMINDIRTQGFEINSVEVVNEIRNPLKP